MLLKCWFDVYISQQCLSLVISNQYFQIKTEIADKQHIYIQPLYFRNSVPRKQSNRFSVDNQSKMKKRRNSDPGRNQQAVKQHDIIKESLKLSETPSIQNTSMMQGIECVVQQLSNLKTQVIDHERREEQIKWLTEINAKLMEKNQDQQETIKKAEQSNIEMEAKMQNLTKSTFESTESICCMKMVQDSLRTENESLNQQKQATEQRIKEMESESARKEITFKEQTETLQSHNNTMNERMTEMKREIKEKNDKIFDLERESKAVEFRREQTFNAMINDKIRKTEAKVGNLQFVGEQLMNSVKEKNESLENMVKMLADTVQDAAWNGAQNKREHERIGKLLKSIAILKEECAHLELQKTLMDGHIQQIERENKTLKQRLGTTNKLKVRNKSLLLKMEQLEKERDAAIHRTQRGEKCIEKLKKLNGKLKEERAALDHYILKMESTIRMLKSDILESLGSESINAKLGADVQELADVVSRVLLQQGEGNKRFALQC